MVCYFFIREESLRLRCRRTLERSGETGGDDNLVFALLSIP
jgi:hypothetical protein